MKPLFFMGSSYKDLLKFPKEVRSEAGFALRTSVRWAARRCMLCRFSDRRCKRS